MIQSKSLDLKLIIYCLVISFTSGIIRLVLFDGNSLPLLIVDAMLLFILMKDTRLYARYLKNKISIIIILLFLISIIQLFNYNVLSTFNAIRQLRVNVFVFIYFFIGIIIASKYPSFINVFIKYILYLSVINLIFGLLEFLFPGFPLFQKLIYWEFGHNLYNAAFTMRITGLLVGPVQFSLIASFSFFYFFAKGYFTRFDKKTVLFALFCLLVLVLSKSRAVIFSTFFITFLFILFNGRRRFISRVRFILVTVIILVIIFVIIYAFDEHTAHVLFNRYFNAFNAESVDGGSFTKGRIQRWNEIVLAMIAEHPGGLGVGFTNPTEEIGRNYRLTPMWAESIYLNVFVELGWFAGGLFLFFAGYAIYISFKFLKSRDFFKTLMSFSILLLFFSGITSPLLAAFPYTYIAAIFLGILYMGYKHSGIKSIN